MNRFPASRITIAALVVLAPVTAVKRAEATDISGGKILSTLTISDDSQLVGDVTCAVPLTTAGANPCIAFGADHIHLRLNGHTITGPVDAPAEPNNCSFGADSKFGVGILVSGRTGVKIVGPGVIQNFERWGILVVSSDHVTVRKVTVTRNCWSGMQTSGASESNFEEDFWANNAAGSHGAACGGICLANSNKNVLHKSTFYGNGSLDYEGPPPASTAGNVDFGIGFEGSSSENRVEENDIGGNTNGVEFFNTSSDNVVRHNIIVGNPAAQVVKTFTGSNQQGADITFRSNFTGMNNVLEDNFCLTYIQGAGPSTAPCPNVITEGVEEAVDRENTPDSGDRGTPRHIGEIASVAALLFLAAVRRLTLG